MTHGDCVCLTRECRKSELAIEEKLNRYKEMQNLIETWLINMFSRLNISDEQCDYPSSYLTDCIKKYYGNNEFSVLAKTRNTKSECIEWEIWHKNEAIYTGLCGVKFTHIFNRLREIRNAKMDLSSSSH